MGHVTIFCDEEYQYTASLQVANSSIQGLIILPYDFAVVSPLVTVGDLVIMTWFLTRDVAGRSIKAQPEAMDDDKDDE